MGPDHGIALDPLGALKRPPNPMPLKKKSTPPPPNQNSWIRPCQLLRKIGYTTWACHDLFVVYNIDHNYTKVFHNIGVVHLKEDDQAPVVIPYLFRGGGINPLPVIWWNLEFLKSENTEKPMIACDEYTNYKQQGLREKGKTC